MTSDVQFVRMKIREVAYLRKENVNPSKNPEKEYILYSIPAYKENGLPESQSARFTDFTSPKYDRDS